MSSILESVEVEVPIRVAYDQWTQFEEFPLFMEGVEKVQQLDDVNLHWVASIAGVRREWDARITEQVPDERVAWTNLDGVTNGGVVTFTPVGPETTLVTLQMEVEPDGLLENVADTLGFIERRASGDLERFRDFITARGYETGGWRGEVHGAHVTSPGDGRYEAK
jgi:uncharacterized membrane protein